MNNIPITPDERKAALELLKLPIEQFAPKQPEPAEVGDGA